MSIMLQTVIRMMMAMIVPKKSTRKISPRKSLTAIKVTPQDTGDSITSDTADAMTSAAGGPA